MTSVLVVGSGLAGLFAAVRAVEAGVDVTLVTKEALTESNTRYAQGGIAASLFADDSTEAHLIDTLRAGAGLCDAHAARVLCEEGPARVRDLIRFGVDFDRDDSGLARGLEAAHGRARVLHAGGDATGAAIEGALIATAHRRGVHVIEHTMLVDLVVDGGIVAGAEVQASDDTRSVRRADAVILATGGGGRLYRHTTNPAVATGDGVAAAWRAGAQLADLEFIQFHPTALVAPGAPLVSEAVRGEGAVLRNARGERFMLDVHPLAELAPRDVVARAMVVEMAAQHGVPISLDATALGRAFLESRFPTIAAACHAAGYDWAADGVPVTPAAHYWMGGVATDVWGRTSLQGLFAVGEVACTGAHGANRLASNSLLEASVFADRAVRAICDEHHDRDDTARRAGSVRTRYGKSDDAPAIADIASSPAEEDEGNALPGFSRDALQGLLWDAAGVLRTGEGLEAASEALDGWRRPPTGPGASRGELEDANLLDLGRLVVAAAIAREESRGAHFRSDFPVERQELAVRAPLARAREDAVAC
ncbi:L-aspartate oxidase [Luethyella okanaganae]|uniref:L-aspartate oxidase n=1 Tax=Luethyella okanaganae TaxID=69372 RepID=A0ABW1VDS4_9MICO